MKTKIMVPFFASLFLSGCVLWEGVPPYQPTVVDAAMPDMDIVEDMPNTNTLDMKVPSAKEPCFVNQRVFSNHCKSCPPGTTNEAGDDPNLSDTQCDVLPPCKINEFVKNNECETCPPGTTNVAGDDPSGIDTSCDAVLCEKHQYVENNQCLQCPEDSTNKAGDDASGGDTQCDPFIIERLSLDTFQSYAISSTNDLYFWGRGDTLSKMAQPLDAPFPIKIDALAKRIKAIEVEEGLSCIHIQDEGLKCWGVNFLGQTGIGNNQPDFVLKPTEVESLGKQISSFNTGLGHACAIEAGTVKCWGANNTGQLGNGTLVDSFLPTEVIDIIDAQKVYVSQLNTCAINSTNQAFCWGASYEGQITTVKDDVVESPILMVNGAMQMAIGKSHICALLMTGLIKCRGRNDRGQLGVENTEVEFKFYDVNIPNEKTKQLVARENHTCALTETGRVYCWGANESGQIGNGTILDTTVPTLVTDLPYESIHIATSNSHTCAALKKGGAMCWGKGVSLGVGTTELTPKPARVLFDVQK